MQILIVGAGNVGRALGRGWTRSGHKVTYAVRDPSKPDLEELRRQGASVISSSGAAAAAEVIALTGPSPAVDSGLKALGTLAGKIVIDAADSRLLACGRPYRLGRRDRGEARTWGARGESVQYHRVQQHGRQSLCRRQARHAAETTLRPRRSC